MSRHVEDLHPQLVVNARAVVRELSEFDGRLVRLDNVDHEQHRVYLSRADRLAGHLRAALLLADASEPASALVLIRTALEHHVQDLVLHRATRYVVTEPVPDEAWPAIQAAYEAQEERWTRNLAEPAASHPLGPARAT